MSAERVRHRLMPRVAMTAAAVAVLLVSAGLVEPIRTAVIAGTGLWTPSPHGVALDEWFFGGATALGDGPGLVAVVSAIAVGLVAIRRWPDALFLVVALLGSSVVSRVVKDLYRAPRPPTAGQAPFVVDSIPVELVAGMVIVAVVIGLLRGWGLRAIAFGSVIVAVLILQKVIDRVVPVAHGFDSFPSGHAASSAALATAVILLAWPDRRFRWPIAITAVAYAFLVGLSRMYLGVHYPADVLAGWCLGVAWTLVWWLAWNAIRRRRQIDEMAVAPARPSPTL